MDKKKITIVTGTGGILGTGHIQRMLCLAERLNREKSFSASILLKQNVYPLPDKFNSLLTDTIPADTGLIIRDMRDSSIEEIRSLKKSAPVLAIDDSGEGANYADHKISLLPVPSGGLRNDKPDISKFLYGYNFTRGINLLKDRNHLKRDIDVAVYAGYDPSAELISQIKKSIPENTSSLLLSGGRAARLTGDISPENINYAEVLSRAKLVITHFGLTMFEAHACGCSIAALNPTSYHSTLTDMISVEFNIIYSSEYRLLSPDVLRNVIDKELNNYNGQYISINVILKKINICTENFIDYIREITINYSNNS